MFFLCPSVFVCTISLCHAANHHVIREIQVRSCSCCICFVQNFAHWAEVILQICSLEIKTNLKRIFYISIVLF